MEISEFGIKDSKLAERVVEIMAKPVRSVRENKARAKMLVDLGDKHITAQWMHDLIMHCIDNYETLLKRLGK